MKKWIFALVPFLINLHHVKAQVFVDNAFPGITFSNPVDIQAPPDGTDRLFIVEKGGTIRILNDIYGTPTKLTTPFLNVPTDVDASFVSSGERGLLGLAFHPDYATNGRFFVYFTVDPAGAVTTRTIVSEFTVSGDPNVADHTSEIKIFGLNHFADNHNAGQIQFGPDGYLYIGMGDGGNGGDPGENGQKTTTLLGSMLRIDVDGGGGAADNCGTLAPNYTIPAENPFVDGVGNNCDEIYAFGLRNPFRFSFAPNDTLWLGDVGQISKEEIDWIVKGGNYGWDVEEGTDCYEPGDPGEPVCGAPELIAPIIEHGRAAAQAIMGGYVYTGTSCGALSGHYIYGDHETRNLWALAYDDQGAVDNHDLFTHTTGFATFGVDRKGEVYLADFSSSASLRRFNCSNLTQVNLRILLHGAYDDQTGMMSTTMNAAGYLPTTPDTVGFWEHPGNEVVLDADVSPANGIPDYFDDHPTLVDWVEIELRTGQTGDTRVASRMAWVRSDGQIVDMDGASPVSFLDVAADDYYVVVRHRNHIDIMSAAPLALSNASALYDFTTAPTQAFGSDMMDLGTTGSAPKQGVGPYALYGGDGNPADNALVYIGALRDQLPIITFLGLSNLANIVQAYIYGDMNLDGQIQYIGGNRDQLILIESLGLSNLAGIKTTNVPE